MSTDDNDAYHRAVKEAARLYDPEALRRRNEAEGITTAAQIANDYANEFSWVFAKRRGWLRYDTSGNRNTEEQGDANEAAALAGRPLPYPNPRDGNTEYDEADKANAILIALHGRVGDKVFKDAYQLFLEGLIDGIDI